MLVFLYTMLTLFIIVTLLAVFMNPVTVGSGVSTVIKNVLLQLINFMLFISLVCNISKLKLKKWFPKYNWQIERLSDIKNESLKKK